MICIEVSEKLVELSLHKIHFNITYTHIRLCSTPIRRIYRYRYTTARAILGVKVTSNNYLIVS